jgi:hypothetical protein
MKFLVNLHINLKFSEMKKITLFIVSILMPILAFSQQTGMGSTARVEKDYKNEFRLNLIMSIAGLPEINYERFVEDNMGLGVAVAFSLENADDMSLRSIVLPYWRVYFGEKKANGFFVEANAAIAKHAGTYTFDGVADYHMDYKVNGGLGAAIGYKWLTRNGIVGELYMGVGRIFGNDNIDAYPRIGITIGKRF